MVEEYLFKSERLGFRSWRDEDVELLLPISSDPDVMEFFPNVQDREYVSGFIKRMQDEFAERGYCYFAAELLRNREFVGFIGLHLQTFDSDFTPCTDIGWRLKKSVWNQGLASEGAKRCLDYAFDNLGIETVYSIAPKVNVKSQRIMEKIGMN